MTSLEHWHKWMEFVRANPGHTKTLEFYKRRRASANRSRLKNPQLRRAHFLKWLAKPGSMEKQAANTRRYRKRKFSDPKYRMTRHCRVRLYQALRKFLKEGKVKCDSTLALLGCPIESFVIYVESRFEPGMSWDNYGKVWEIDHIIPCDVFDLTKEDHQRACFHFSNLRPLWVVDNRKKGAKFTGELPQHLTKTSADIVPSEHAVSGGIATPPKPESP